MNIHQWLEHHAKIADATGTSILTPVAIEEMQRDLNAKIEAAEMKGYDDFGDVIEVGFTELVKGAGLLSYPGNRSNGEMKIYGFDSIDVERGEINAVIVPGAEVRYRGIEAIATDYDWICAHSSFNAAKAALLSELKKEKADPEVISIVKSMTASCVTAKAAE